MEKLREFIKDVNQKWLIEYSKINNSWCYVINEEEAFTNKDDNIYFLWWTKWQWRSKDSDIEYVSYVRFDLDIVKNCQELYWADITYEELDEIIIELKDSLEWTFFKNWRYIVNSWRGIHIYLIWDAIKISPIDFSLWVKRLYNIFYSLFKESHPHFEPDYACSNISRIMRLPWTINQKNKKECKIVFFQDKKSDLTQLQLLADAEKEEQRIKQLENQKKIEEALSKYKDWWNELYELINTQIPAWQIAQLLVPQFPFNWRKNFKNEKWWFCGYYYVADSNSICNWWSRYFNWWDENSCWSNFELIKRSKNFTNAEVFAFYKDLLKLNQK